jgi:hypothetical protein
LTYAEISSIFNLKPREMNLFHSSPFSPNLSPHDHDHDDVASLTQSLSYHPVIPLDVLMNSSQLQRTISFYSESLLMDAMFIQSIMGYSIKETDNPLPLTCQILQQLLDHGLTYVITQPSAKLLILFPLQRSMILLRNRIDIISSSHQTVVTIPAAATAEHSSSPLHSYDSNYHSFHQSQPSPQGSSHSQPQSQSNIPLTLQKRMKDFPRIFRNKIQSNLSFRINSNFDHALQKLREHHGTNCWINSDLEIVWKVLLSMKQFYIFELWYGNGNEEGEEGTGGEVLLAADFCHLSNHQKGVYVATRYHNTSSEYKAFQSGYLLASLSCQYLQRKGYLLWDLGGVDLCPLMRYKNDVAGGSYHRAEATYLLQKIQMYQSYDHGSSSNSSGSRDEKEREERMLQEVVEQQRGGEIIEDGIVIDKVTVEDTLWK